ncbi:MAG: tetratricopeptide repeat protein [Pseudomonadota bacterium]|uniref:YfgM family protein n=1 Tax=Alcanivorax sp. TaxID=1872427 RepID=UPI0025B8F93A|nr:tetratricopeptide repeat protein [Alcanivorax sp.]MED5240112.1 tetratricopeptide repeat protein [Pseudomonadota bacterium]MEE3319275.1 tetratricopeptide repeat protein [Pseudomonadota bacterium]
MVDYIRDEEEQAELLKNWWKENGTATIITIVLAVAALIGWREWQGYQGEQSADASSQYQSMLESLGAAEVDAVTEKADVLIEDFPGTAYADHARLAKASLAVSKADYDTAATLLEDVADNGATDALTYTAKLRLARVHLQQQAWDKAESVLSGAFPEAFNGMALELRGDAAKGQGDLNAAQARYSEALDVLQDGGEKDRVQMKLDDLKTAS